MDERALIGREASNQDSDGNHSAVSRFQYDNPGLELESVNSHGKHKRRKQNHNGMLYERQNSFSLDSGQGGHYSPYPISPFPLPNTRIDGEAYINPVFVDDYPPSPKPRREVARDESGIESVQSGRKLPRDGEARDRRSRSPRDRRDRPRDRDKPRDKSRERKQSDQKLKRRQSRSADRAKPRTSRLRRSAKSLERSIGRLSGRNRKYAELKSDTDSDYQNGDYRSDTSLPPNDRRPKRQHTITKLFSIQAREFLRRQIESTSSKPSDTSHIGPLVSDITDDSVFMDDTSLSTKSDTSKLPIEPTIRIENETQIRSMPKLKNGSAPKRPEEPRHFTFDRMDDRILANGTLTSPPLSPAVSDLDDDFPDVMTSEDADDMIVMLLSNRSPCVAKLIAFCGIMQMIAGFITMISGASGFLSDITVFDFKFDSPIAFWCGALFAFSGAIGIKTSHTKRRSMNIFAMLVSFCAGCSALFVLVMTSDPGPIYECAIDRKVLYYFHLFLINVEIMSSAVLCFMCLKSLCDRTSAQPNEVQVLKTLSKYGLKPEHSVPQMAAAKAAAAAKTSRPGTPSSKTPIRSPNRPAPKTPSANSSRSDVRPAKPKPEVHQTPAKAKPELVLTVPNGTVIQPPPETAKPRSRERRKSRTNRRTERSDRPTNERTDNVNGQANGKATPVR